MQRTKMVYKAMKNNKLYTPQSRLRDVIKENSSILMVMSRFGISLGFGNKSIQEICDSQGVDINTFLSVTNFISHDRIDYVGVSLSSLMNYLKRAHTYFLDYNLPTIRRRLIEAIDCSGTDDVAFLILRFYDEYVTEVSRHMAYENDTVFDYVERLLQNKLDSNYSIDVFSNKHNHIGSKLNELKDIIISYYPGKENDHLNSVLFDIMNCEGDLTAHCLVEDKLFIPAVKLLEEELRIKKPQPIPEQTEKSVEGKQERAELSNREKEILCCVAKGLTNKEIANELYLSVFTVTTHRRNICNKLQIHTSAGLTIYAIVNKLINLQDVKIKDENI